MRNPKKTFMIAGLLVSTSLFGTGCESTGNNTNTVNGAVVGTGLGALTGAVIGSMTGRRNAAAGALIGAAAGGVGGALIGHNEDQKEQKVATAAQAQYAQAQAAAEQAALTNQDILFMVQNRLSENVIINSIHSRGGRFDTTPDAIVQLKASGVSDTVIEVMQHTPPPSATVPPPGAYYGPPPAVGVYVRPRPYYYDEYGYRHW